MNCASIECCRHYGSSILGTDSITHHSFLQALGTFALLMAYGAAVIPLAYAHAFGYSSPSAAQVTIQNHPFPYLKDTIQCFDQKSHFPITLLLRIRELHIATFRQLMSLVSSIRVLSNHSWAVPSIRTCLYRWA